MALDKLVMRASRDQVKVACGNLHLYAGLKNGLKGATNTVGQKKGRERCKGEGGGFECNACMGNKSI